jgi:hypothetical protein
MSLELLSAVASVGTFIVIAATAIAAIVQLHHLRGSNQIVALNEFREEFESPELKASRGSVADVAGRLDDPAVRRDLEADPLPDWLQTFQFPGRLFETLGGYVKHGIVSADIVCDLWGAPIIGFWKSMAPAIVIMRRSQGDALYENFEMLACMSQRWMERHPTNYPKNLPRITPPDRWLAIDQQESTKQV